LTLKQFGFTPSAVELYAALEQKVGSFGKIGEKGQVLQKQVPNTVSLVVRSDGLSDEFLNGQNWRLKKDSF